jgi:flagellar M-ring protein FliF
MLKNNGRRKVTGIVKSPWKIRHIKKLFSKRTILQHLPLIGIAVLVIAGFVALFIVSSALIYVPVFNTQITDQVALDRIVRRINEEGVKSVVSPDGLVQVSDENTARRIRAILIREDLVPKGTDPWAIFNKKRWTATDFMNKNNVNFRRTQTQMIADHLKALDDIDDANVIFVGPEHWFPEWEHLTVSVIITPKPGSDITTNRKKVEGIQKLLKFAVVGLIDEDIVITDYNGNVLNEFTGMAGRE